MNGSSLQSGYMEDVDGKVCVKEVLVIWMWKKCRYHTTGSIKERT